MIRLAWDGVQTVSDVGAFRDLTLPQLASALKKPVTGFLVPAGPMDACLSLLLLREHQQVFVVPPVLNQDSADERLANIKHPHISNQQFLLKHCDLPTYQLAVAWRNGDMLPAPLAQEHPAWPFLSFTSTNIAFARQLIATVGDWRWYWHERHPGRLTKLYAHMGLFPDVVERVIASPNKWPSRLIEQRCHTLIRTWFDENVTTANAKMCRCFERRDKEKFSVAMLRHCRFLLRTLMYYWESRRSTDQEVVFYPWRVFTEAGVQQFLSHVSWKSD